jgi:tRNA(Ile)-lysidine synthase
MTVLTAKIKETIAKYSLLKPGERVVVAVSGGPDSTCLLFALHALSEDLGISLHVAHLDHMFRGKESADEALFVADLAKRLGLPATLGAFDVPAFLRERGLSPQDGARTARYGFLNRVAAESGAGRIATGHTADDQAETFLMRLMRGAGVAGLSSIPPIRENVIRPLLGITRSEVLEYLRSRDLAFVTDSSNAKPLYTRNRVRSELIPLMKRFNPRIVETLAAEAELLRDEDEAVEAHLENLSKTMLTRPEDDIVLERDGFNALPPAFRRRLLRKLIDLAGGESSLLSRDRIDSALSFMASAQSGRRMLLPGGLALVREYDRFVVSAGAAPEGFSHALIVPGGSAAPEAGLWFDAWVAERLPEERETGNYCWQAAFDYDKIGPFLTVRSRRPGDRFLPAGMGGKSKKLQDYFVDAKVPRRKRDAVPLLCSGDDILWVVGLRTDERFLARGAGNVLVVRVRRGGGPADPR